MLLRLLISLAVSQHLLCAGIRIVCYDEMRTEFQCYDLWAPYTNTNFHLPASPSEQQIQFRLYTVHNRDTPDIIASALDPLTLQQSHWNHNLDTKIIVHGFTDSGDAEWVADIVRELLHHPVNVIVVDWAGGAKGPNYFQAAANCRVVGAHIASLILTAEQLGSPPSSFHIIGHSLGGQIAGYAGARLKGRLGRISGLDVAAPLFENYDDEVKLEKTDAIFVDVIHTDAEPLHEAGFGTVDLIGHVDFFPNGGIDMPGCPENKVNVLLLLSGQITTLTGNVACSHNKVTSYYAASINDNDFRSYPCASADGNCHLCGTGCANMGYHATSAFSGLYVTSTNADYPF